MEKTTVALRPSRSAASMSANATLWPRRCSSEATRSRIAASFSR